MAVDNNSLTQAMIDEFVLSSHGNYGKVRKLLMLHPQLAVERASWGETALDAALHASRPDIERFLRSAGAIESVCPCAGVCRAPVEKLTPDFRFSDQ